MLNNVKPEMEEYGSGYSNWLDLMMNYTNSFYEVAIVGNEVDEKIAELHKNYLPNILIAGSKKENNMPLLVNRFVDDKTLIYICVNNACKLPVNSVEKALRLLED